MHVMKTVQPNIFDLFHKAGAHDEYSLPAIVSFIKTTLSDLKIGKFRHVAKSGGETTMKHNPFDDQRRQAGHVCETGVIHGDTELPIPLTATQAELPQSFVREAPQWSKAGVKVAIFVINFEATNV